MNEEIDKNQEVESLENIEETALEEMNMIESIKYKLDTFEGPLDLLLHLIKEKKMDIMEVRMAEITDQYLAYIQTLKAMNMELATEFLVIASTLIEIKSRSLIPTEEVEEETDEISDEMKLKLQLQEYQLFKEAGENLHNIENVERFYKAPDKSVGDPRIVFNQFNLDKMLDAFARILMKAQDKTNPPPPKQIKKDRWTVAEKIAFIKTSLIENKEINFFSLFDVSYSKLEIINVFLAILELLKFQYAQVVQSAKYEDITIKATDKLLNGEFFDSEMKEKIADDIKYEG